MRKISVGEKIDDKSKEVSKQTDKTKGEQGKEQGDTTIEATYTCPISQRSFVPL